MAKANARRWKISQRVGSVSFFCAGVGHYHAGFHAGRSARIHRFLSNLFRVRPTHPQYERHVRGWTVGMEERYGDQTKYGGIKYLTFFSPEAKAKPGVCLVFTRKIPPLFLFDDLKAQLEQVDPEPETIGEVHEPEPKPKPKRKRAPRKKKTSTKVEAPASNVEAKSQKPEGDKAPEGAGESS